jgi:hypothetical protein
VLFKKTDTISTNSYSPTKTNRQEKRERITKFLYWFVLFGAKKQQTGCLFRAKKILEHIKRAMVRTGPLKSKKILQPIFIETIRATASCWPLLETASKQPHVCI